jgi:hypothetical protein
MPTHNGKLISEKTLLCLIRMAMPGMTPLSWGESDALLNCSQPKRLQKVMILYRLIWLRDNILFVVENLGSFLAGSGKCRATLVK